MMFAREAVNTLFPAELLHGFRRILQTLCRSASKQEVPAAAPAWHDRGRRSIFRSPVHISLVVGPGHTSPRLPFRLDRPFRVRTQPARCLAEPAVGHAWRLADDV